MATKQPSRFVWRELMTTDVGKAVQFYTRLFGWKAEEMDMGGGMKYTMFKKGDKQVGGAYKQMPEQKNIPSNWLGYVSVENVDAASDKASSLGGKIMMPPADIPNVGRFSVVMDPQQAAIALFRGAMDQQPQTTGKTPNGEWCWAELMTRDISAARKFYTQLFGWAYNEHDMGPMGMYTLWKTPGTEKDPQVPGLGGMMAMEKSAPYPPHWLQYVESDDVDGTCKRAKELGAQVHMEPMDIPNIGRFAVLSDPTGAAFALFHTQH
jgi:predicted enzyme related to lactoylglutathione lyase